MKKKSYSALEKIKNPKRTQIVVENLLLEELIDKDVIKSLKEKFSTKYGQPIITSTACFSSKKRERY